MPRKVYHVYNENDCAYYVYKHYMISSVTGEEIVFYIGRGKYNRKGASYETIRTRAFSSSGRSDEWNEIHARCTYYIEIVKDKLSFWDAAKLERDLVSHYGRLDIETGSLVNLCEGGEGTPDRVMERMTLQDHIDKYVEFIPFAGCWVWTGYLAEGKPKINIDNKTLNARPYLYEQLKGVKFTRYKQSLKDTCGCSICVNPDHMKIVKGTNTVNKYKKITEEDRVDAKRLLKYFYPSQIAYLFPHITENTLGDLATKLNVQRDKPKSDWAENIPVHTISHLSLEEIMDIKRLASAGVSHLKISQMYNLNRVKVTTIANGTRANRVLRNLLNG